MNEADLNQPFSPDEPEIDPIIGEDDVPADHRSGFVAVIGRPNVGKSTLMNHYLGQKIAITSPKPQTTRNQLLGILTLPNEDYPDLPPAQVIFIDTPGIHQPKHKLGEYLVETARRTILDADLVLWLVDATEPPTPEDRLVAEALQDAAAEAGRKHQPVPPVLLAINKIDAVAALPDGFEQPFLDLYPVEAWMPISATRGDNRRELLADILNRLPLGPRYYPADQVTDQHLRFMAGELIREAALQVLHQEVPHALAVIVNEFKERSENMTYINATLVVERESQKPIVIGQKGRTLKKIGQLARAEIENLVGTKVYLELWVKVRPKWRKKENDLYWLGYKK
ncbi:MAG: GTPase Era [Chloroflexi bacterium]|nr:MAG: GTPase Era [Chloroflexota bacterium]